MIQNNNFTNIIALPNTPSKLYVHKPNLDRFSPSRSSSNLELAGHLTHTSLNFRSNLNVFAFNNALSPHSPYKPYILSREKLEKENFNQKYGQSPLLKTGTSVYCSHSNKSPKCANLKLQCIKTLDAPYLNQDEHYHLMDWFSSQDDYNDNLLAVALGCQIFIYDVIKEVIIDTIGAENDENGIISCLKWNLKNKMLAYTTKSSETTTQLNGPKLKNCLKPSLQSSEVFLFSKKKLPVNSDDIINYLAWESMLLVQGSLLKSTNNCYFAIWDTSNMKSKYPILTWSKHLKLDESQEKTLVISVSNHNSGYLIALVSNIILIWSLNHLIDANHSKNFNHNLPTLLCCKDVHIEDCIPNEPNSKPLYSYANKLIQFKSAKWYPCNSTILVCCGSFIGKNIDDGFIIFLDIALGNIMKTCTLTCTNPIIDIIFSTKPSIHFKGDAFFSAHQAKRGTNPSYDIGYWNNCGQPNTFQNDHKSPINDNLFSLNKIGLGEQRCEKACYGWKETSRWCTQGDVRILGIAGDVHNQYLATLASDETIKIWSIIWDTSGQEQKATLTIPGSCCMRNRSSDSFTNKLNDNDFLSFL